MFKIKENIEARITEKQATKTDVVSNYYEILNGIIDRGNNPSVKKHKEKGKLFVRDRIALLLDKNTPFLELSVLASYGQYEDQFPSAGIITGVGTINNKKVIIIANDATVKGGTYVKETIKKHLRAQEIALENNLPCVYMVD